jgi:hypothetical protein
MEHDYLAGEHAKESQNSGDGHLSGQNVVPDFGQQIEIGKTGRRSPIIIVFIGVLFNN